jgi:hypothetical protein
MEPRTAQAAGTVTFTGSDLAGSIATVRIGGEPTGDGQPLRRDDRFAVAVPALAPGVYEVVVDIGGLARFEATLEVTP